MMRWKTLLTIVILAAGCSAESTDTVVESGAEKSDRKMKPAPEGFERFEANNILIVKERFSDDEPFMSPAEMETLRWLLESTDQLYAMALQNMANARDAPDKWQAFKERYDRERQELVRNCQQLTRKTVSRRGLHVIWGVEDFILNVDEELSTITPQRDYEERSAELWKFVTRYDHEREVASQERLRR